MKFLSLVLALVVAAAASYTIKYTVDHFNQPPMDETGIPLIMGFTAILIAVVAVVTLAALRDYKQRAR